MADKYLKQGTTNIEEVEANSTSAGAADSGKIVALNADGEVDATMLPSAEAKSFVTAESLVAGDIVHITDNAGTAEARKADATDTSRPAMGFVKDNATAPAAVTVYFEGTVTGLSGLTAGVRQFLSETAGAVTATVPTTSGAIAQAVGYAISTTEMVFEADGNFVVRA